MIQQGDSVFLVDDVLSTTGNVLTPQQTGRGVVVGWQGTYHAVVQWGGAGDYVYATVPLSSLRKYEVRSQPK